MHFCLSFILPNINAIKRIGGALICYIAVVGSRGKLMVLQKELDLDLDKV